MKKSIKIIGIIVIVIGLFVGWLYTDNRIGISKANIESAARYSQKIDDTWLGSKDVSDDMAAMIFFSEDKSDFTYSIYIKRPDLLLSTGYFFRRGGNSEEIRTSIQHFYVFSYEGVKSEAFVSMNESKINRIELNNRTIEIDGDKPFSIVVPVNSDPHFYNDEGEYSQIKEANL